MVSWIPKTYKAFELKVQERGWKCIDSLMMKDTFVYAWKRGEEMFLVTLKSSDEVRFFTVHFLPSKLYYYEHPHKYYQQNSEMTLEDFWECLDTLTQ